MEQRRKKQRERCWQFFEIKEGKEKNEVFAWGAIHIPIICKREEKPGSGGQASLGGKEDLLG